MKIQWNSKKDFLLGILFSTVFIYFLTPRFWELNQETWKAWSESHILRQTGGFPFFSHGPLYVVYLSLFSFLKYPNSVFVEYILTHVFCYTALFLLLRKMWAPVWSWILLAAWIPHLAILEPTAALAGMGFLALYMKDHDSTVIADYFPASLIAAAMCHSAFGIFLVGHVMGAFFERQFIQKKFQSFQRPGFLEALIKGGLFTLALVTVIHPSRRWDHNHEMMDSTYCPIPLTNPVTDGFFQIGTFYYATRNYPASTLYQQDWYFTHQAAYNGAQTIAQAVFRRPDTVIKNLGENFGGLLRLPLIYVTGAFKRSLHLDVFLALFSYVICFVGLIVLFHGFREKKSIARGLSMTLGTLSAVTAFMLTIFSPRYVLTLLPVAFVVIQYGLAGLASLPGFSWSEAKTWCLETIRRQSRLLIGTAFLFAALVVGVCLNQPLFKMISQVGRTLSPIQKIAVWAVLVCMMIFLVGFSKVIWGFVKRKEIWILSRRPRLVFVNGGILLMSLLALASAPDLHGWQVQMKAVFTGQPLLVGDGSESLPMATIFKELTSTLNKNTRVLALEDLWIKAHMDVNLENVFNVFYLPPFADSSGTTEKWLNSMDEIWVSTDLTAPRSSVSTQSYLRYDLHIRPFLKKVSDNNTWKGRVIKGYGEVWSRS